MRELVGSSDAGLWAGEADGRVLSSEQPWVRQTGRQQGRISTYVSIMNEGRSEEDK